MEKVQRGDRRKLIDTKSSLSLRRQCELLCVNRSSLYYKRKSSPLEDIDGLNKIRDVWYRYPFYGYRKITKELKANGDKVNRKRVQRLMASEGIRAIYPGPNTSKRNQSQVVYPYLLKEAVITSPNDAWQVDITYLRMGDGFMYLVSLIDMHSRYVVGWRLSNTLETERCLEALQVALKEARPKIINSDQGCQFTSHEWVEALNAQQIKLSRTGKGRCWDNVYIERFWRSFKREEFYLNDYKNVKELKAATKAILNFITISAGISRWIIKHPHRCIMILLNRSPGYVEKPYNN